MIENNKTYGFTIAVKELKETVPNIFRYASAYKRMNNLTSKGLWEMFVDPLEKEPEKAKEDTNKAPPLPEEILRSDPNRNSLPEIDLEAMEGEKYNMCHFWSNFEIASLEFFRSKEYEDFFQMMDRSGGFWMERVSGILLCFALGPCFSLLTICYSGVMLLFTRSRLAPCLPPEISTTSVILATDTPPFNIAQPMPQQGSSRVSLS